MAQNDHEAAAMFYVATDGNDGWSGRLAEPNAAKTDGPFATLGRARDTVRELKGREAPRGPMMVMVRGGKYFLDQTLVLGPEDSGSREFPVTYRAYGDERPILSGGKRITGWKPYLGKIAQAVLGGAGGGGWKFRQLFLNGEPQVRSRYPKLDPKDPLYGGWAFMEGPAGEGSAASFIYKPGTFQRHWAKLAGAEVVVFPHGGWTGHHFCRNIVFSTRGNVPVYEFLLYRWSDDVVARAEGNVFFFAESGECCVRETKLGGEPAFRDCSLAEWQKLGFDTNSVVVDPLFVDPVHDDYRLRPDSPAIRLGFVPIDFAKMGIRS
jgi:hypothetical protein